MVNIKMFKKRMELFCFCFYNIEVEQKGQMINWTKEVLSEVKQIWGIINIIGGFDCSFILKLFDYGLLY